MPRLIVTVGAARGLERCRRFLKDHHPLVSSQAATSIRTRLEQLSINPEIGRPVEGFEPLKELVIGFGNSGYVALYRYEPAADTVYLLAFRHQREAGY